MNFQHRGAPQGTLIPVPQPCVANDFPSLAHAMLACDTPATTRIRGLRKDDMLEAVLGLRRFLDETPKHIQRRWGFMHPRDPRFRERDDGVIQKRKDDRKHFLHYRRDLPELLAARGLEVTDWHQEWFQACDRILGPCVRHLFELAREMDRQLPGYNFEERARVYADQNVVRILSYVPLEGVIAKPHTDRCAITFHLAESDPGLCAYKGFEKVPLATPATPEALCFHGQQLERITRGAIPALYHEVENNSPERPRWAIVFFGKMCEK